MVAGSGVSAVLGCGVDSAIGGGGAVFTSAAELVEASVVGPVWLTLVGAGRLSTVMAMRSLAVGSVWLAVVETRRRFGYRVTTDATSVRLMVLVCRMLVFQRTWSRSRCSGCGRITVALADSPWTRTTKPASGWARVGSAWAAARRASAGAGAVSSGFGAAAAPPERRASAVADCSEP